MLPYQLKKYSNTIYFYAFFIMLLSSSTNEIYSVFTKKISFDISFVYFSFFAFLAAIYVAVKNNSSNRVIDKEGLNNLIFKYRNLNLYQVLWIIFLSFNTIMLFYCLLNMLKKNNPFVIITLSIFITLINTILGIVIFKDTLQSIKYYIFGFMVAILGLILFTLFSDQSGEYPNSLFLILFFLFSIGSSNTKIHLRRNLNLPSPEDFMIISFFISTMCGIIFTFFKENLIFLPFIETAILAYIGIVPTAIASFEIQKLEDKIGIPTIRIFGFFSPLYILITQSIIFILSFGYIARKIPSFGQVLSLAIIIIGVIIAVRLGKPQSSVNKNVKKKHLENQILTRYHKI